MATPDVWALPCLDLQKHISLVWDKSSHEHDAGFAQSPVIILALPRNRTSSAGEVIRFERPALDLVKLESMSVMSSSLLAMCLCYVLASCLAASAAVAFWHPK